MTRHYGSLSVIGAAVLATVLAAASKPADAAVQLTGCTGGSFGDSCGLDELVSGGSMVVSGYRFSGFSWGLAGGRLASASAIRVDAVDGLGGFGFSLIDTGPTLRATNGDLSSNDLTFDITPLAGTASIAGATLAMALGDIDGSGSEGSAFADFFDAGVTSLLGNATAYCDGPACGNRTLSSGASFASAQGAMWVVAGVDVAAGAGGLAQINELSVLLTPMPEPPSSWLLGIGALALAWRSRGRFLT